MNDDPGGRLSRWSRRKLAARRGEALEELPPANQPTPDIDTEKTSAQAVEAENVDVPKLPPIEELTRDSDYTVFLAKNVPETLRRAALQKLWRSDPVFANLDRLNDYDEDYSFVETIATAVRTSYQVGKGYVDEAEKKLAELESTHSDKDGADERHEQTAEEDVAAHATGDGVVVYNDAAGDNAAAAARQNDRSEPDCPSDGQLPDKDN
jgi:hypothetical protein